MTPEDQARIIVAAGYPFGPLRDDSWLEMPASAMITAVAFAIRNEREACAKIAADRAAVCQSAYDAGDRSEVHPLNEALHIAQLIRNRT